MDTPKYDEQKFKNLILYIAQRSEDDPNFGATKINKILFFADFDAFAKTGKPITGARYQRLPQGPAPRALLPVKKEMLADGSINEREVLRHSTYQQKRIVANKNTNMDLFTGEEIAVVDAVIARLRPETARRVSDLSHERDGWSLAENGEEIPYFTAILHDGPVELTAEHLEYCKDAVARIDALA